MPIKAKAPGLIKGEEFTLVAIKMLKDEASEDLQVCFLVFTAVFLICMFLEQ